MILPADLEFSVLSWPKSFGVSDYALGADRLQMIQARPGTPRPEFEHIV
jgi:hypothetical protein